MKRTLLTALTWAFFVGGLTAWVLSAAVVGSPRIVLDGRGPDPNFHPSQGKVVLSGDGRTLAAITSETVDGKADRLVLVDLTRPGPNRNLHAGPLRVHHVQFVDDGRTVAAVIGSNSFDDACQAVLWDVESGRELRRTPLVNKGITVTGYTFRDDGRATVVYSELNRWHSIDGETGKVLATYELDAPPPGSLGWSGPYLIAADSRGAKVWRAATGEALGAFPPLPGDWQQALGVWLNVVHQMGDQCLIANIGEDRVQLWNARTGERRDILTPAPFFVEISGDGRWLLVNSLEIPPPLTWWQCRLIECGLAEPPPEGPDVLVPRTRIFDLAADRPPRMPRSFGEGRMAADGTIVIWSGNRLSVYDNPPRASLTPLVGGIIVAVVVGLVVAIRRRRTVASNSALPHQS